VCQLDTLGKCRTRATLRASLATLPHTLEKTYDRILSGIPQEDSVYAIRILLWLTFAERPLSLDEIAEVVAIDPNRDPVFVDDEKLEDPMELLDICSSLVSIVTDNGDKMSGSKKQVATLAHYSVKEYFLSARSGTDRAAGYSLNFNYGHSMLARACLKYLLQVLGTSSKLAEVLEHAKLISYCADFWMHHAREAGDQDEEVTKVAIRLLSLDNPAYKKWFRVIARDLLETPTIRQPSRNVAHPLYYAASFGLTNVVDLFLKDSKNVALLAGQCRDAIHAATKGGHQRMVKLLLDHGAPVDAEDSCHTTALQMASATGSEQIAKLLISAGANVNSMGGLLRLYGTALEFAVINNHVSVAELLLKNGADVAAVNIDGLDALHIAAEQGHLGIAKLLLEHGANTSTPDFEGRTPISLASGRGHDHLVKLLLEHGGGTSILDQTGWTPLIHAANKGHYNTVKLLVNYSEERIISNFESNETHRAASGTLNTDNNAQLRLESARPEQEDIHGETALSRAAMHGHDDVLTLLFAVPGIGPNFQDRHGRTALWWAAAHGHVNTVMFLLHEHQCDSDIGDSCGRTPQMIAGKKNHRNIVDLLQGGKGNPVIAAIEDLTLFGKDQGHCVTCDVCTVDIAVGESHYHCNVCANGDWDICAECNDFGIHCNDDTHTLVSRTMC
jgi:ankyrin repeat protein